jgi:hypothetical protein
LTIGFQRPINLNVNITGADGIASAILFWRNGTQGPFAQMAMTQDGYNFSSQIPGQTGTTVQYFFKATDINGVFAYHPVGDSSHPFSAALGVSDFIDSLDHGLLYWESGGINDFWGFSAKYSRSGQLSITESTIPNYRNNTNSYLRSRFSIDLSGSTAANFSFWWRGLIESNHDTLFVEVSTDGGNNWNRLPQFISASGFSFAQYNASLAAYLGNADVRVQFHFKSDASGRREGIYIDDIAISGITTGIEDGIVTLPDAISLAQNYPNPFNPSTKISFFMLGPGKAELAVFDLLGRQIRSLVRADMAAGEHQITWDGRDNSGADVASGVYVYRLRAGDASISRRMTLLR